MREAAPGPTAHDAFRWSVAVPGESGRRAEAAWSDEETSSGVDGLRADEEEEVLVGLAPPSRNTSLFSLIPFAGAIICGCEVSARNRLVVPLL